MNIGTKEVDDRVTGTGAGFATIAIFLTGSGALTLIRICQNYENSEQ